MTTPQPSGVDLARTALAAARAAAKTRPTQPQKKAPQGRRETRRGGRDPMALGTAITGLMTDRGWTAPEAGGSILDQWPTIAPELDGKVAAVRFEHDTGILHLRPVSPAYATQLRLHQAQVLARIQQTPAGRSVRSLKILPVGAAPAPVVMQTESPVQPVEPGLTRTRETASIGYREALAAVLEHRPEPRHTDPYIAAALERQEAALRANRQPEPVAELDQAAPRRVDRSEAVRRAALARKRQEQTGVIQPRRAADVA